MKHSGMCLYLDDDRIQAPSDICVHVSRTLGIKGFPKCQINSYGGLQYKRGKIIKDGCKILVLVKDMTDAFMKSKR